MKQRAKRLMALFMAGVFALSTCMTSGPYTVMATEAGTAGVTTPSEGTPTTPSQGSTTTPDNTTPSGTPEEGETTNPEAPTQVKYGLNLPQTIHDVEYGTIKVNYAGQEIEPEKEEEQDVVKFDTEITDLSLLQITSENYNFSNITVENGQITIATATPKLGEISGLAEITVDENENFVYTITNSAWSQWVEWTTSDEKVIITKDPEVTGTANVVAKGYDGNDAKTVYVKAAIDNTSIEKEVIVKKKNVILSIAVEPENGGYQSR